MGPHQNRWALIFSYKYQFLEIQTKGILKSLIMFQHKTFVSKGFQQFVIQLQVLGGRFFILDCKLGDLKVGLSQRDYSGLGPIW